MGLKKNKLFLKAIDLSDSLGVKDYVWHFSKYKEVLEFCLKNEIIILGGDIILFENSTYNFESSSWHYGGQSYKDSINTARVYLEKYSLKNDVDSTYIAFVFKGIN